MKKITVFFFFENTLTINFILFSSACLKNIKLNNNKINNKLKEKKLIV